MVTSFQGKVMPMITVEVTGFMDFVAHRSEHRPGLL
jgi:hypothetical protein